MPNLSHRPSKRPNPGAEKGAVARNADKVLADRIRKSLELKELVKRSTLGLYSLKTKESSFGVPFVAVSDHFALLAAKQMLPLADLYRVGSFCLCNGKCVSCSRPVLVLDNKVS